ncbi:FAD-dependent monooxygenase [Streptomyces orinoci]|uniref:FAD-dependent monooxygenase n=1 Tax=Streptomyces orinoci TaxID=67339 RepID=A0ABV3JTZ2_STRON|nr:FAD-dependent monooxygenase [Streptomyces orinoci]
MTTDLTTGLTADTALDADVVVIGAGPTGLLLAGDLAAAGVSTLLLERRGEESNLTRAFAVHARTLEVLDARGLAEELLATGTFLNELRILGATRLDVGSLPTRFPGVLITPQYETERVLQRRAERAGLEIRRGTRCTGVRQDAEGVQVSVEGPDGAGHTLRARYAVGTDGVHSAVRQALGIPFPGHSILSSVLLADARLATDPGVAPTIKAGREGFALIAPFGDGWYRVIGWRAGSELPSDAPADYEDLRDLVRSLFGTDFGMGEPRWTSRFHSDERQAPRYREGRVFLAGDAAHVHSPAGGMGMNTGIQDAANLSWKLAAVLQGRAGEGLLDSYQTERHPVGRQVLRVSGAIIRAALVTAPPLRVARAVAGGALGLLPGVTRRAALTISGLDIAYPAPPGSHPLTGRRAPDLPLAERESGPVRLYEALRAGEYVRVLPRGSSAVGGDPDDGVVTVTRADAVGTTLLVRPDGYVESASE